MSKKIPKTIITGGDGIVGSYFNFGIKTDQKDLDITDLPETLRVIEKHKPKIIIHLAAETNLDKCEQDPQHAYFVNSIGTYNIALAAKEVGAKLIYLSTSAVFDGVKGSYSKKDISSPQNYYGRSKHLGEVMIQGILKDHLIIRACWVFGGGPAKDHKFVGKIIRQIDSPKIYALNDTYGSPTYAKDLVKEISSLIIKNAKGIVHVANKGRASRYDMVKLITKAINPKIKAVGVKSSFFKLPAKRGRDESIISSAANMRSWQEALEEYISAEWGPHLKTKTSD